MPIPKPPVADIAGMSRFDGTALNLCVRPWGQYEKFAHGFVAVKLFPGFVRTSAYSPPAGNE